jgi:hypothetical protein
VYAFSKRRVFKVRVHSRERVIHLAIPIVRTSVASPPPVFRLADLNPIAARAEREARSVEDSVGRQLGTVQLALPSVELHLGIGIGHSRSDPARTCGAGFASLPCEWFDFQGKHSRRGPAARAARFFRQAAGLVGPAARLPRLRTVGPACAVQGFGTGAGPGRGSSEDRAPGSSPGCRGFDSRPQHAVVGSEPAHTGRLKTSRHGPEGNGRPERSALACTGASCGTRW